MNMENTTTITVTKGCSMRSHKSSFLACEGRQSRGGSEVAISKTAIVSHSVSSPPSPSPSSPSSPREPLHHSSSLPSFSISEHPAPKGYSFLERIGSGTFARVFLGLQHSTGEQVAIKVVDKRPLSPCGLEHVMKEIEALWQLNHRNIMQMFDMVETEELLYIITELCEGDLLWILRHRGAAAQNGSSSTQPIPTSTIPLPLPSLHLKSKEGNCSACVLPLVPSFCALSEDLTRHLFSQLIDAMTYAHENNFCHRDIKLENLFVTKELVLKVGDWGFASNFTPSGFLTDHCGSLPYAAPEIYFRQRYSGSEVDVWSIGVCLYVMVAGSFPFEAKSGAELIRKIHQNEFFMPPWFSPELRHLINRFFEPIPSRRVKLEEVKQHPWMLQTSAPIDLQCIWPSPSLQPTLTNNSSPIPSGPSSPCISPISSPASSPRSPSPLPPTSRSSPQSQHLNQTPPIDQPVTGTTPPDIEKGGEQPTHENSNPMNGSKMIVTVITKGFSLSKLMLSQVQTFTHSQYNFVKGKAKIWRDSIESCLTLPLEVEASFSDHDRKEEVLPRSTGHDEREDTHLEHRREEEEEEEEEEDSVEEEEEGSENLVTGTGNSSSSSSSEREEEEDSEQEPDEENGMTFSSAFGVFSTPTALVSY